MSRICLDGAVWCMKFLKKKGYANEIYIMQIKNPNLLHLKSLWCHNIRMKKPLHCQKHFALTLGILLIFSMFFGQRIISFYQVLWIKQFVCVTSCAKSVCCFQHIDFVTAIAIIFWVAVWMENFDYGIFRMIVEFECDCMYDLRCKYKGYVNVSSQIKASFSHDGKYIVAGAENKCIYIWKTNHEYSKLSLVCIAIQIFYYFIIIFSFN